MGTNLTSAIPELSEVLYSGSDHYNAAFALCQAGEAAGPHLLRGLTHASDLARNAATAHASCLKGQHADAAIPAILENLETGTPTLRALSATTIGRIGRQPQKAIPRLLEVVRRDDLIAVQFAAARAVGDFGVGARDFLEELEELAGDKTLPEPVRQTLALSIERIEEAQTSEP